MVSAMVAALQLGTRSVSVCVCLDSYLQTDGLQRNDADMSNGFTHITREVASTYGIRFSDFLYTSTV